MKLEVRLTKYGLKPNVEHRTLSEEVEIRNRTGILLDKHLLGTLPAYRRQVLRTGYNLAT